MAVQQISAILSSAVGNTSVDQKDGFWPREERIDGRRWNQVWPYQLVVVEKKDNGYVEWSSNPGPGHAVFTLPIPPESMTMSMPFAINTSVTLGGIIEEHNGSPIRMLSFSGTTGVLPARIGGLSAAGGFKALDAVSAGVINAAANGGGLFGALNSFASSGINIIQDNEFTESVNNTTGYYQFRLLQNFLEDYASMKKKLINQNVRLAVAIHKDESVYLVTPLSFELRRSSGSPLEYTYSLSFKAWKRIKLAVAATSTSTPRTIPNFAKMLDAVAGARRKINGAINTINATTLDVVRSINEPIRELSLLLKDITSASLTLTDVSPSVMTSARAAIVNSLAFRDAFKNILDKSGASNKIDAVLRQLSNIVAKTDGTTTGGGQGNSSGAKAATLYNSDLFEHPEKYQDFLSLIDLGRVNLPPKVRKQLNTERDGVRKQSRKVLEGKRDNMALTSAKLAQLFNVSHPTFEAIFDMAPITTNHEPTDTDFDALHALNTIGMQFNTLAVSDSDTSDSISSVDYIAGLARQSGIAFTTPTSKFAVPFSYGSTLERLAEQYLNDPNRWHEIAALNGLRSPYVDEEGFSLPLSSNGHGNQVVVADATNLYSGQAVWISSTTAVRTKRRITKIEPVGSSYIVITVDGDPDLNSFFTVGQAYLHAFLPDTVNSQQVLYIPSSDEPSYNDLKTKAIPGLNEFDPLIQVGGVDLLLTPTGDLAITDDGDVKLAIGLTNIVQRVRTILSVKRGDLNQHPDFGLGDLTGQSTADINTGDVIASIRDSFKNEPEFSAVESVRVSKSGGALNISVAVKVAATGVTIPVSVIVKR